jgi:malonate transporter
MTLHDALGHMVLPIFALIGTGPLVLANLYHRDATVTAGSVLISTITSLATISLLLTLFTA